MDSATIEGTSTAGSLIDVDPATLVIGANVRLDPRLDRPFVSSIRERGVLEPVVAYRDDEYRLVVLYGQRRTLAAAQVKRASIPVMVVAKPIEPDRLVDQVVENEHREALTTVERLAAFEQLSLLGLSAGQIARRTAAKRVDVEAGLAAAGSEVARSAVERWDLTLDEAGVVAEFADDPVAVEKLATAAHHGGFDHVAQRLRDNRAEAAARATAAAALTAAGVTVVDRPAWDSVGKRLSELFDDTGEVFTADSHKSCPGHAAYIDSAWNSDDEDSDDTGDDDEDSVVEDSLVYGPVWVCTDAKTHGHKLRWGRYDSGSGRKTAAEMSEAEREAARADRRDVIESNKAWTSAETVRRDWLRTFVTRKTAPKGSAEFVAVSLASCDFALRQALEGGNKLAHELLDLGEPGPYDNRGQAVEMLLEAATDTRALLVALTLVLASYEHATGKNSWRTVNRGTARYLRFIEAQGYELSDVERRACGEKSKAAPADA